MSDAEREREREREKEREILGSETRINKQSYSKTKIS